MLSLVRNALRSTNELYGEGQNVRGHCPRKGVDVAFPGRGLSCCLESSKTAKAMFGCAS